MSENDSWTENVREDVRKTLEAPLNPAEKPKPVGQLVLAGEPGLQYDTATGIVWEPDGSGGWRPDARKFTFHRAWVNNPWGATPEEQFQYKNVFDAPTQATAARIAKRVEAIMPGIKTRTVQEQNFMIYQHSHTPWAVEVIESSGVRDVVRLRLMAGRQALHIMRLGWGAWKGEMKRLVDEIAPDLPFAWEAVEPKD